MARFKTGSPYFIEFWDHCKHEGDSEGPLLCRVYGVIVNILPLSLEVAPWVCPDDGTVPINRETYSILKSTVVKSKLLR